LKVEIFRVDVIQMPYTRKQPIVIENCNTKFIMATQNDDEYNDDLGLEENSNINCTPTPKSHDQLS